MQEWLHCCRCYGRIASSSSSSSSSNNNNNNNNNNSSSSSSSSSNNNNSNNSKRAREDVLQRRAPQQQEAVSFWQADVSAIRGTVTATIAEMTMVVARVRLLAKWYFLTRSRYYRSLVILVLCIWVYRTNNNGSLGASFAGKVIDGKARCVDTKWLNVEVSLQLFNAPCALTKPDNVAIWRYTTSVIIKRSSTMKVPKRSQISGHDRSDNRTTCIHVFFFVSFVLIRRIFHLILIQLISFLSSSVQFLFFSCLCFAPFFFPFVLLLIAAWIQFRHVNSKQRNYERNRFDFLFSEFVTSI